MIINFNNENTFLYEYVNYYKNFFKSFFNVE